MMNNSLQAALKKEKLHYNGQCYIDEGQHYPCKILLANKQEKIAHSLLVHIAFFLTYQFLQIFTHEKVTTQYKEGVYFEHEQAGIKPHLFLP